jgi:hypothetical protein
MHTLKNRITRLEAKTNKKPGVVVVSGYSEVEHERAIADLIANGGAHERDLFVCLMRFGERPHSRAEKAPNRTPSEAGPAQMLAPLARPKRARLK